VRDCDSTRAKRSPPQDKKGDQIEWNVLPNSLSCGRFAFRICSWPTSPGLELVVDESSNQRTRSFQVPSEKYRANHMGSACCMNAHTFISPTKSATLEGGEKERSLTRSVPEKVSCSYNPKALRSHTQIRPTHVHRLHPQYLDVP
jgi:hypothetical protein